jgi:hypothetical protein
MGAFRLVKPKLFKEYKQMVVGSPMESKVSEQIIEVGPWLNINNTV